MWIHYSFIHSFHVAYIMKDKRELIEKRNHIFLDSKYCIEPAGLKSHIFEVLWEQLDF